MFFDPRITQGIKPRPREHAGEPHQCMQAPGGDRRDPGAGAIAVEDHADTKKRCTQDHAQEIGRLNLVLRMSRGVQRPNADPSYEDGRQHNLQDCEIPEAELVHNDVVIITPPRKAAASRPPLEPPNRSAQVAGTVSNRKVRLANTLARLPRNVPTRNNM